jgi:hypothetical protein
MRATWAIGCVSVLAWACGGSILLGTQDGGPLGDQSGKPLEFLPALGALRADLSRKQSPLVYVLLDARLRPARPQSQGRHVPVLSGRRGRNAGRAAWQAIRYTLPAAAALDGADFLQRLRLDRRRSVRSRLLDPLPGLDDAQSHRAVDVAPQSPAPAAARRRTPAVHVLASLWAVRSAERMRML